MGSEDYNERIVQSQWEKQRRWTLVYKGRRKELYRSRISKLVLISVGAVAVVEAARDERQVVAELGRQAADLGLAERLVAEEDRQHVACADMGCADLKKKKFIIW